MGFGERMAALRKQKGLSQEELARHLNISRGALSMYEIGKREPDYDTLKRMADFFGVSIDYLLGRIIEEGQGENKETIPLDLKRLLHENGLIIFDGQILSPDDKRRLTTLIGTALSFKQPCGKGGKRETSDESAFGDLDIERLAARIEDEYGRKPSKELLQILAEQIERVRREGRVKE